MKRKAILITIMCVVLGTLFWLLTSDPNQNVKSKKKGYSKPLVKVKGKQLMVDFDKDGQYEPYFIKGVNYRPMPIGRHPKDFGWKDSVDRIHNIFNDEVLLRRDFEFLKKMGCNTIRLWKANSSFKKKSNKYPNRLTKKTLDLAEEYGIKVIAGFWIARKPPRCSKKKTQYKALSFSSKKLRNKYRKSFAKFVKKFRKHPAILFWAIGNENNYDIDPLDFDNMQAFYSMINSMAKKAHEIEGKRYHPVAFVNGEIDSIGEIIYETQDIKMKYLDIWGVNVYRGNSFGDLFEDYGLRSDKPLWISEYGIDSWDSIDYTTPAGGEEDQETQAQWVGNLWDEIIANKDTAIGATVTEYSDEWWRPYISKGRKRIRHHHLTHDYYGIGPKDKNCDGYIDWTPSAPDNFFHMEWFGIMSIEEKIFEPDILTPKKAYYTLQRKFTEDVTE